jgi:hypothetical protein
LSKYLWPENCGRKFVVDQNRGFCPKIVVRNFRIFFCSWFPRSNFEVEIESAEMVVSVFMVAEKPSLAQSIAQILSSETSKNMGMNM